MEDIRKVAQYSYLRLRNVKLFAKIIVFFRNLESECLQGSDWTLDLPVKGARLPERYRRITGGDRDQRPSQHLGSLGLSLPIFMVICHPANQECNFYFINLFLFLQFNISPYVPPYKSS